MSISSKGIKMKKILITALILGSSLSTFASTKCRVHMQVFKSESGSSVRVKTQFFPKYSYEESNEECKQTARKIIKETEEFHNKYLRNSETEVYEIEADVVFGDIDTLYSGARSN